MDAAQVEEIEKLEQDLPDTRGRYMSPYESRKVEHLLGKSTHLVSPRSYQAIESMLENSRQEKRSYHMAFVHCYQGMADLPVACVYTMKLLMVLANGFDEWLYEFVGSAPIFFDKPLTTIYTHRFPFKEHNSDLVPADIVTRLRALQAMLRRGDKTHTDVKLWAEVHGLNRVNAQLALRRMVGVKGPEIDRLYQLCGDIINFRNAASHSDLRSSENLSHVVSQLASSMMEWFCRLERRHLIQATVDIHNDYFMIQAMEKNGLLCLKFAKACPLLPPPGSLKRTYDSTYDQGSSQKRPYHRGATGAGVAEEKEGRGETHRRGRSRGRRG
jgi:hypothetical protein